MDFCTGLRYQSVIILLVRGLLVYWQLANNTMLGELYYSMSRVMFQRHLQCPVLAVNCTNSSARTFTVQYIQQVQKIFTMPYIIWAVQLQFRHFLELCLYNSIFNSWYQHLRYHIKHHTILQSSTSNQKTNSCLTNCRLPNLQHQTITGRHT